MGTDAPTTVFIPVHCAPKKAPCPHCGKMGKRKRTCTREVRTVAFKAVAYLKITYGEYTAQCECCTTFRITPEGGYCQELCLKNSQAAGFSWTPSMKTVPLMTSAKSGDPFNERQLFDADSISL